MEAKEKAKTDELQTKILYLGVVLDVFLPFILAIIAYAIKNSKPEIKTDFSLDILLYALLFISAGDLLVCFILKKKMFSDISSTTELSSNLAKEELIFKYTILIFSLCLAPSIYGFVYYLLGGTLERYVLFVVITMVGHQFLKPRDRDFKKAFPYQS
jgi:hypothetical protein